MKKINRVTLAYMISGVCIIMASILIYHILSGRTWDASFSGLSGEGTKFEFSISGDKRGFSCEQTFCTEKATTNVSFSGEITVDECAEISFISNEDNSVVHSEKYNAVNAGAINFNVDGLTPYSFYTLKFTSNKGKKGHLLLTTNESLTENIEPCKRQTYRQPVRLISYMRK